MVETIELKNKEYKDQSFLEKSTKTIILSNILNVTMKSLGIRKGVSKFFGGEKNAKNAINIANSILSASLVSNDGDTFETLGAAMVSSSLGFSKNYLKENTDKFYDAGVLARKTSNKVFDLFSEITLEKGQKIREGKTLKEKVSGFFNDKDSVAKKTYEILERNNELDSYRFNEHLYNFDDSFKNYFLKRKNLTLKTGDYKSEHGLFNFTGRYVKDDGKLNVKKLVEENKNLDFFIKRIKEVGGDTKSNDEFMEDLMLYNQDLKKQFKKNNEMGGATVRDFLNSNQGKEFREALNVSDNVLEKLQDVRISKDIFLKDKQLYDKSIFDFKSIAYDIGIAAEASFRPFFLIDGKLGHFSPLSVFKIKERAVRNLEFNDFKILKNNFDYGRSINEGKKKIKQLRTYKNYLNEDDKIEYVLNNDLFELDTLKNGKIHLMSDTKVEKTIKEIEVKISKFKKDFEVKKNTSNLYKNVDPEKSYTTFEIKKGDYKGKKYFGLTTETKNKVTHYIKDGEYHIKKGDYFQKVDGTFDFTYDNKMKKEAVKKLNKYYTTDQGTEGIYLNENEIPESFKFRDLKKSFEEEGVKGIFNYIKNNEINFFGKKAFNEGSSVFTQFFGEKIDAFKYDKRIKDMQEFLEENENLGNIFKKIKSKAKTEYKIYKNELEKAYKLYAKNYESKVDTLNFFAKIDSDFGNKLLKYTPEVYNNNTNFSKILYESTSVFLEEISENITDKKMKNLIDDLVKFKRVEEVSLLRLGKKNQNIFKLVDETKDPKIYQTLMKEGFDVFKTKEFTKNFGDLRNNIILNNDFIAEKFRKNLFTAKEGIAVKRFASEIKSGDSLGEIARKIIDDIKESDGMNGLMSDLNIGLNRFEETLEGTIGVARLDPHKNDKFAKHFSNLMLKRILPAYLLYKGVVAVDSASDAFIPDETPLIGNGASGFLAKAAAGTRIATQKVLEGTGIVGAIRTLEETFPGFKLPFNLSSDSEYLKEIYFQGKLIEIKKNRWWFTTGRQSGSGTDHSYLRPHMLFMMQNKTSGLYENKVQKFFRKDFQLTGIPWLMVDPYLEERINAKERPYPLSSQLFSDVPVLGGMLNATLGQLIKPVKKIRSEEWDLGDNAILNPDYDGQSNTPKFLHYSFKNDVIKGASDMFEDLKTWSGMPGYMISAASKNFLGKNSLYENETTLATMDQANSITSKYEEMDLGGMAGLTEGVRRIIIANRYKQIYLNPLKNNMPDWIPDNYYKDFKHGDPYKTTPYAQYLLPGKVYEDTYGLHSDEYGKYGLIDRVRILATTAPFSKEYRDYKKIAEKKIANGEMKKSEEKILKESFDYAEMASNKSIYERNFRKANTTKGSVGIKKVLSSNEFVGRDNKRYKLSGIENSFNTLSKKYGNDDALKYQNEAIETLKNFKKISFIKNEDITSSVKTDRQGEYIEIYSEEFNKLNKKINKQSYLANSEKGGVINAMQSGFEYYQNAYKPFYMEKFFGRKDAYHSFYDENVVNPAFKDWNTPFRSFVQPMLDMASEGAIGGSMAIAFGAGGTDRVTPILPAMIAASFAKGLVFGPNKNNRYDSESNLQDKIEFIEYSNMDGYKGGNINSIYNMNGNESISSMKGFLSNSEKKFLPYLSNETNNEAREKILSKSSDRLSNVLKTLWNRQSSYAGSNGNYTKKDLPIFNNVPKMKLTNNSILNEILIKKILGVKLNSYEKKIYNQYGDNSFKWKNESSLEKQLEFMLQNQYNSYSGKTISSITPMGHLSLY